MGLCAQAPAQSIWHKNRWQHYRYCIINLVYIEIIWLFIETALGKVIFDSARACLITACIMNLLSTIAPSKHMWYHNKCPTLWVWMHHDILSILQYIAVLVTLGLGTTVWEGLCNMPPVLRSNLQRFIPLSHLECDRTLNYEWEINCR